MTGGRTRMEKDSMGEMSLPESALYGAKRERREKAKERK